MRQSPGYMVGVDSTTINFTLVSISCGPIPLAPTNCVILETEGIPSRHWEAESSDEDSWTVWRATGRIGSLVNYQINQQINITVVTWQHMSEKVTC